MPGQLVRISLGKEENPSSFPSSSGSRDDDQDSSHRLTALPILILNVHERCNCRCLMCDIWRREEGRELAPDDIARHRESIQRLGVRQVVLTGGEPLLHSRLSAICSLLHECNATVTLLTTGLLLKKRAELVAFAVDEVILSLDGPEEIHDAVRRVKSAFQLIRDGVRAVRRLQPEMPIHARCTVQRTNHTLLRRTVRASRVLGLSSISFLAADVTSQAFNRDQLWSETRQDEIALTRCEVSALEEEMELLIREHSEDIASKYIVERPEKLRRIVRHFKAHLGETYAEAPRCNAPWVSAVIGVDGSVRPCFFHPNVGSIANMSLGQALNSSEAQAFRANLDIAKNPICRRCVCSLHYR